MMKKRAKIIGVILLIIYIIVGLDTRIQVTEHMIDSAKVNGEVKIGLITDLHSCDYGEGAKDLMKVIDEGEPDLIVMVGDIIDDHMPMEHALEFLEVISNQYPCYYVTGNHELWTNEIEYVKAVVSSYGIEVLEGDEELVEVNGEAVIIAGIDDYDIGEWRWREQLRAVAEDEQEHYKVLLTHRPYLSHITLEDYYDREVFDLVLTGHTHGGQWRFPGLIKAVLGPDQGLFPEFSGGLYELSNTTMILSRGLAKESTRIFRFYNRPEVVMITIQ